ncbi:hypothetical protein GCM10008949_43890 [Deinococcus humi]|nr:hypothetical protein GCM10008949_43890 [Deinococcus humi]
MGSFDYIAELRAGLLADRITWEVVLDRIHGSTPWQKETTRGAHRDILWALWQHGRADGVAAHLASGPLLGNVRANQARAADHHGSA